MARCCEDPRLFLMNCFVEPTMTNRFLPSGRSVLFCVFTVLAACAVPTGVEEAINQQISIEALNRSECEGHFVAHQLPFATGTRIREMRTYESNGAGVAVNDLDGDGDLDLVFASIDRAPAILWNQGEWAFEVERLPATFSRGVNSVDVDGDGLLDIVFTHRGFESLSYWRNLGMEEAGSRFEEELLDGVESYAYSMAWADLSGDGRLDLVTGSYNIDLRQNGMDEPDDDPNAGVFVYTQAGSAFDPQRLAGRSEALSVALVDLNDDDRLEIWVANDFDLPDMVWAADDQAWQSVEPFSTTSFSTMSIDWGDIMNRGELALFTTDMMPYDDSPENVLQVRGQDGAWVDQAAASGVQATGWSWAGKFGDLDNDGFLDLYVVNGMIAVNMFGHLPHEELVEENQVLRNVEGARFESMPDWALNAHASGRGMVMADMDRDGDLDIVVSNLRRPAQLFENRLCGGHGLLVELSWPDSGNSRAIGARVQLQTDHGVFSRDVRASGGYLSGDAAEVHFGMPTDTVIHALIVTWPDGTVSIVDGADYGLVGQTKVVVTR